MAGVEDVHADENSPLCLREGDQCLKIRAMHVILPQKMCN
jgi:hypothetical protein